MRAHLDERAILDAGLVRREARRSTLEKMSARSGDGQFSNSDNMALVGVAVDAAAASSASCEGCPRSSTSEGIQLATDVDRAIGSRPTRAEASNEASTEMHGAVPLLHDYLAHAARGERPDKVALVCGPDERLTYVRGRAARDGRSPSSSRGSRRRGAAIAVIVFADNSRRSRADRFLEPILEANAVVCMVNPQTKADKLAYLLGRLSAHRVHRGREPAFRHVRRAGQRGCRASEDAVVVSGRADDERVCATMPHWPQREEDALARGTPRKGRGSAQVHRRGPRGDRLHVGFNR